MKIIPSTVICLTLLCACEQQKTNANGKNEPSTIENKSPDEANRNKLDVELSGIESIAVDSVFKQDTAMLNVLKTYRRHLKEIAAAQNSKDQSAYINSKNNYQDFYRAKLESKWKSIQNYICTIEGSEALSLLIECCSIDNGNNADEELWDALTFVWICRNSELSDSHTESLSKLKDNLKFGLMNLVHKEYIDSNTYREFKVNLSKL